MPYIIFLVGLCGAVLASQFKESSELLSAISVLLPSFSAISDWDGFSFSSYSEMFLWPLYFALLITIAVLVPYTVGTVVHFFGFIKRVSNGTNQAQ